MRKIIGIILAAGAYALAMPAAHAARIDDVLARTRALEKENAALRRENAALRENKVLRARNAALKTSAKLPATWPVPKPSRDDPYKAYAADMPVKYKAPPPLDERGRLRLWGEGGAIFTAADPNHFDYSLVDPNSFLLGFNNTRPGSFDLAPRTGWEAAAGFDYRFAGSPWHVSGQFRYSRAGTASGTDSLTGDFSIPFFVGGAAAGTVSAGLSDAVGATYRESHWLADIAIGRDILGSGPDALQLKAGLRLVNLIGKTNSTDDLSGDFTVSPPTVLIPGLPAIGSLSFDALTSTEQRNSFFGAGPRVGIEGSAPFAGRWSFDYQADAAVLFGTQRIAVDSLTTTAVSPAFLGPFGPGLFGVPVSPGTTSFAAQRVATVFNADAEVGVSYWVTQSMKLSASYRLDAYFNALATTIGTGDTQSVDRYIHGPRVGLTAQF